MGIGDSIGAAVGAKHKEKALKRQASAARRDRERALGMAADAEYDPFLISEQIGPYQRSQSPVARGYLESFLTGANPDAVQGTRAGAPQLQARAQGAQQQAYGGWDALRARQREMEQSTPWEVRPFTEQAVTPEMRARAKALPSDEIASKRWGITPEQVTQLREGYGITFDDQGGWHGDKGGVATQTAQWLRDGILQGNVGGVERFLSSGKAGDQGAKWAKDDYLAHTTLAQRRGR